MTDLPTSVRYVKNGAGGRWWPAAKAGSQIHAGWSSVPDEMLATGNFAGIEKHVRAEFGGKPGAMQDVNALRALIVRPSQHLWVTFEDGFMWWATARDGITLSPENETADRGHFWLTLDRPWSNASLAGKPLAMADLPGGVTTTAGFKGTVCEPKGRDAISRIIRDEDDADVAAATVARQSYVGAVAKLVERLGPKDFEVLVDLVLSRSGWARIARLGGTTEGVDVEVENVAINEIAFVQVKSAAGQDVLDDYVARFQLRRERFARMIFAVHSPKGTLKEPEGLPVQVWDAATISDLVVRLGLADWLAKRV